MWLLTWLLVLQVRHHGSVQVHAGALEEEAVGRDEVSAARAVLAVPSAVGPSPGPEAHQTR